MITTLAALSPAWKTILPVALLTAALAVGTILAHRIWTDLKGEGSETPSDPNDLLGPLADAYSEGQMSEEEYRKIRTSIERGLSAGGPAALPVRPPAPSAGHTGSPGGVEERPSIGSEGG